MIDDQAVEKIEASLGCVPAYVYSCRLREGDGFMGKRCVVGGEGDRLCFVKEKGFDWEDGVEILLANMKITLEQGSLFSKVISIRSVSSLVVVCAQPWRLTEVRTF